MKYIETLDLVYLNIFNRLQNSAYDSHDLKNLSMEALKSMALASAGMPLEEDEYFEKLSSRELCYALYWRHLRRIPDAGALTAWSTQEFDRQTALDRSVALSNSVEARLHGRRSFHGNFKNNSDSSRGNIYIDVSNTIDTKARTGIQRVVRNISFALEDLVDVNYCYYNKENDCYFLIENIDEIQSCEKCSSEKVEFSKGDIFFDVDGSWGDSLSRSSLYYELKKNGVIIFAIHYDAAPILFPQFSHPTTVLRYAEHFAAVTTYVDVMFCISRVVCEDLDKLCASMNIRIPTTKVIEMGYHFGSRQSVVDNFVGNHLYKTPYVLCVGTVEPRKNYKLVLDNIDAISELGYKVIIVGKRGWESQSFFERLEYLNESSDKLIWLNNADDQILEDLYLNASALIVPSFYEGYGLPVLEGLARGCRVLVSNGGALPEALSAGNGVIFQLEEESSFLRQLKIVLALEVKSPSLRGDERSADVSQSWSAAAKLIYSTIEDHWQSASDLPEKIPLVYISIHPSNFSKSIESFLNWNFPFGTVSVLTSEKFASEFELILDNFKVKYEIFNEEELLAEAGISMPEDHQERNYTLRNVFYKRLYKDYDVFLACDDDAILISAIVPEEFLKEGKYQAYQYYDSISEWKSSSFGITSFDRGQWYTGAILNDFGYNNDGFAAHRPQIVKSKWAMEIANELKYIVGRNLDEWATYFNIAIHRYPFAIEAKQSTVLNWPANFASWMPNWFSDRVTFLNYYPDFGGINSEKIILKKAYEYNLYHFQRMFCENFVDSVVSVSLSDAGLETDGVRIYALRGIWVFIPMRIRDEQDFVYCISQSGNIIIDGRNDVQKLHSRTNLMIKVPSNEGLYDISIESVDRTLRLELELVVLPCAFLPNEV